ncbi:PH domain-containing protein [Vallitalea okinawensis]|uniref:PH domain-containing protein n=1 Tax=Vallitalea okinawensis TaxID=2078660 RepID=UPI000CFB333B|nr:PH domain-containing protein [Vallitalea okinawensis]
MYTLSLPLIGWVVSIFIVLLCFIVATLTFNTYRSVRIATSLLFFFMLATLIISPLMTGIKLDNKSINIYGHNGFLYDYIEYADIVTCETISLEDKKIFKSFRKIIGKNINEYRVGYFELKNGLMVKVMINSDDALLLTTSDGEYYLLGPDEFNTFVSEVKSGIIRVNEYAH